MSQIANMAETYYIPFAPHNNSSAGTAGDAHVCASVPNFLALFHRFDDPTWNDVVNSDEAVIQDGHGDDEAPGLARVNRVPAEHAAGRRAALAVGTIPRQSTRNSKKRRGTLFLERRSSPSGGCEPTGSTRIE